MLEAIGLFVIFTLQIKYSHSSYFWKGPVVQWIE